jgi:uncharacterized alpha-E superfamily protein
MERADMTTRILDIGSVLLAEDRSDKMREYENSLWIHVLKSLSALLMYRKHRRRRVNSGDVLDYLLKDRHFPRAVAHCLQEVQSCIGKLPQLDGLQDNLAELAAFLQAVDIHQTTPVQLHGLLDVLQARLAVAHQQIASTWFLPDNDR